MLKPRNPRSRIRRSARSFFVAPALGESAAVSLSASASVIQLAGMSLQGLSDRFAHLVLRARLAADEARVVLLDCLPVRSGQTPAVELRAIASPQFNLSDRFGAAFARAQSVADEARGFLRECLPVKSVAAAGADETHPRASPPVLSISFAAAFALMRSAAEEARTILSDCLPVKSVPGPASHYADQLASSPTVFAQARSAVHAASAILLDCLPRRSVSEHAAERAAELSWQRYSARTLLSGLSDRISTAIARARVAADEARVVLQDCLPVKSVPALAPKYARACARRLPRAAAWTPRLPYSAEERQVAALLLLPFLLLASALAISHSVRRGPVSVEIAAVPRPEGSHLPIAAGSPTRPVETGPAIAPVMPRDELSAEAPSLAPAAPVPPAQIAMLEVPGGGEIVPNEAKERGICVKTASLAGSAGAAAASLVPTPEGFGMRLAQAARAQVEGFVIYDDKYRSISYPMGDVPFLFGVCTDVVVRAYRALGLDLQELVQQARSGSGDRSIDHRRTEVLRRFFAARGESLPVTSFAEDYLPGDIVTYYRPQNRKTRSHIAIVSDIVAPSGRPMIVHNRGWGPEIEDALFVDQITGHYRYYGPAPKNETEKAEAAQAVQHAAAASGSVVAPVSFAPAAKLNR